jgi:hypothetical protein
MAKYRMYVDEVGNSDLGASNNPNHRYLSLTGVIIELDHVERVVHPELEALKARYFSSHPDDPVILHRKELVNQAPPFAALKDPAVQARFDADILALLLRSDYTVITAVIDKLEHHRRYTVWRFDPYHYCLTAVVERFVSWLKDKGSTGDVMAESRGGKEDRRLKDSFERLVEQGSEYVTPEDMAVRLTSRQLKVKSKANNSRACSSRTSSRTRASARRWPGARTRRSPTTSAGGSPRSSRPRSTAPARPARSTGGAGSGCHEKTAHFRGPSEGRSLPPPGTWIARLIGTQGAARKPP